MRELNVDFTENLVTPDALFVLQVRTVDESLLPKLKGLKCRASEVLIPFIHLFLSRKTTSIDIDFDKDFPVLTVASAITRSSVLCPDLESITFNNLPKDPVITEAVSEMLLACNRDALQCFYVDSLLTKEAYDILFQLPNVSGLWAVLRKYTPSTPVSLPNLNTIDVEYDGHIDWLQGFRGGVLDKLETIYLRPRSRKIGDILEEFKSVALTTSIPLTLSRFKFLTFQSWNPSYRSLLPFTQLTDLVIEFSCEDHCSSCVDDDIIIDLARAMPKLKILQLGSTPCEVGGGVTVKGLIALARGCRLLSELRIHFETASFLEAVAEAEVSTISNDETTSPQQGCALTSLEVGGIPIPTSEGTVLKVTVILLQVFPRLLKVKFSEKRWKEVLKTIKLFRQIGAFVQRTGKTCPHIFSPPR